MKTAVIFDNFGPYHLARLRAAATVSDLLAIEVAASSAEYEWKCSVGNAETLKSETLKNRDHLGVSKNDGRVSAFKTVTLLETGTSRGVSSRELAMRMDQALDGFQPRTVFIPGWSGKAAFVALSWCARQGVPAIAMSESTEWDESRGVWREAVKRRIAGLFSAALVGGRPHKEYMSRLGMPAERIFFGYDAVDNGYFLENAEKLKSETLKLETRRKYGLPEKYFLASARFIQKKNLPGLIEAYARYRVLAENAENLKPETLKTKSTSPQPSPQSGEGETENGKRKTEIWNLVLLGDGPLKPDLCRLISDLRLGARVLLPGFKQYPDLPAYYGLAGTFIHASTTEQWGLVVNEAMASGLPVLVSNRCGCAADLVQEGVNGFMFDPYSIEEMAHAMLNISAFQNVRLSAFGDASRAIISGWGPERFAEGLKAAAAKAAETGPRRAGMVERLLLKVLAAR